MGRMAVIVSKVFNGRVCSDEAADGAVGEVYRLEVYDGRESKVVYASRDDWERVGLDDLVPSAAPTRQGASDAAARTEQQAAG